MYKVRGLNAPSRLPERLVFEYKSGSNWTWPLRSILKQGYKTLFKIYSSMKRTGGFTPISKSEILNKITEISKSWNEDGALPRNWISLTLEIKFIFNPIIWWSSEIKMAAWGFSEIKINSKRPVIQLWKFLNRN